MFAISMCNKSGNLDDLLLKRLKKVTDKYFNKKSNIYEVLAAVLQRPYIKMLKKALLTINNILANNNLI